MARPPFFGHSHGIELRRGLSPGFLRIEFHPQGDGGAMRFAAQATRAPRQERIYDRDGEALGSCPFADAEPVRLEPAPSLRACTRLSHAAYLFADLRTVYV